MKFAVEQNRNASHFQHAGETCDSSFPLARPWLEPLGNEQFKIGTAFFTTAKNAETVNEVPENLTAGSLKIGLTAGPLQFLQGSNALPNRDPADVTRFKAAAAKRVQAHRARARMGLRCLTVRVSDRT
jgi:hypothetical protein